MIRCTICGHEEHLLIGDHVFKAHNMSLENYVQKFPGVKVASEEVYAGLAREDIRRKVPPLPGHLQVIMGNVEFPVNMGVDPEACLQIPKNYRLPQYGELAEDLAHALIALRKRRSLYIWGMPGTGKDALFHAWSAWTRTPTIFRQTVPGTDVESWFFSRSFNSEGTFWEEGEVLKAMRDGYLTSTGNRIPYMILISDMDRANRDQTEHFRLLLDSIEGRVHGPGGAIYRVFPGTLVVATANTAGGGDSRGRMVSANPIDASVLDRFQRKLEMHYMDWRDEGTIVQEKFPLLAAKAPWFFGYMGEITRTFRQAIQSSALYAEFSHRAVCSICEHAEDFLSVKSLETAPGDLLLNAARVWLDGLPDPDVRKKAVALMDPILKGGSHLHRPDTKTLDF